MLTILVFALAVCLLLAGLFFCDSEVQHAEFTKPRVVCFSAPTPCRTEVHFTGPYIPELTLEGLGLGNLQIERAFMAKLMQERAERDASEVFYGEPVPRFTVTEKAQRPARRDGTCFYCNQKIGAEHLTDCVLVKKRIEAKVEIFYELDIPAHWDAEDFEQHRNESSYCADNVLREIEQHLDGDCMCGCSEFSMVEDSKHFFLEEV